MKGKSRIFKSIAVYAALALVMALGLAVVASPEQAAADAQQGWYAQDPGNSGLEFHDISVVNANTAWAAAKGGWVVKTTDGGSTWVRKTGLPGG